MSDRQSMRSGRALPVAAIFAVFALGSCSTADVARRGPGYKLNQIGNPADVVRPTRGLWVLQGGGDQSNYLRYWKDTPVEDAANFVAAKPAPIGGTSAGMAVLGEYVYSAMGQESLTSAVAMADPYAADVTLARGFLRLSRLENVLTDQHLEERDRIGRTVALLSRLQKDGWSSAPKAIAADRETSLHVDPADDSAQVFATADHPTPYIHFMSANQAPERCEPGQPLTSGTIDVYRLAPGAGRFDLESWTGSGGVSYELRVQAGTLLSSRGGTY